MTRLFCIKEDSYGKPIAARLMRRAMCNQFAIDDEIQRLVATGKWTRVACLCADSPLLLQAAQWAADLLEVNPRYVIDPNALVCYIRSPNWNNPDVEFAHYEYQIKLIGSELHKEFASYRKVPMDEAERQFKLLQQRIGLNRGITHD